MKRYIKYTLISLCLGLAILCVLNYHADIPLDQLKKKYTSPASRFVDVQGMSVHYRDEGSPTDTVPLVLLHGIGASLHTWEACIPKLTASHRVITLDLPAYGLTGPNLTGVYSPDFYAKFVHDFLVSIGVKHCHIGGNSLGGGISWNFTSIYPDMVEKLILIDASGYSVTSGSKPIAFRLAQMPIVKNLLLYISPKSLAKKSITNVYVHPELVNHALVDRYFDLYLRPGNRQAFVDRLNTQQSYDTSEISHIMNRTLIIWGDKDQLIPLTAANRFVKHLPNDTLIVLSDVGHVPMEEAPDRTAQVILDFLR